MAPIQKCYDVKISAPGVSCRRCGGSSKRSWDTFLPIARRGSFFQDSFFANIQHDFDAAVRDVLNRWSDDDLTLTDRRSHSDIMGRYRQLRSRNRKEENQAITVTSDSSSHKIVLDMHDFMGGDVKVKVVGEKELVVEGRMEKEEGRSSMSAHSFRRRFSLPHLTDMTAITSVMSSDGILIINVPEVEEDARQKATVIPVHVEKTENSSRMQNWESSNTSSTASAEATSVQGKSLEVDQEECECARCSLENRCQAKNTQIALSNASHSRTEEGVSASKQSSSVYTKSSQNEGAEIGSYGSWDTFLPITRRGNFFKDSFFSDIHQDFNSAIKEVLERWNDTDLRLRDRWDGADFLDHYRQLRSRDLKEENQAITVASGNSSYKIVLDVHDFMAGDVKVKVVDERELLVEGRVEKKEEGSSSLSSYSFRRRFTLPQHTDMTAITSVMSSDGILTITAPAKNGKAQQAKSIPVTVEGKRAVSQESSSSTKTSVTNESVKERKEDCECLRCSETSEEKTSQKPNGMKIPIQIIGSVTKESEKARSSSADTYVSSQENVSQTQVQEQKQRKAETITSKESSAATSTSVNRERQSGEKRECESQEKSSLVESTSCHESGSKFIPIRRRGLFFSDSVFQDTRDDFHRAIKEVLRSWGEESSMFDALTSYRNLRSRDLREENQAVTSLEDESYHKFVLDVHDFMNGGEISVKAVNDRELVVEGHLEKKEDGSKSSKRFLRRFVVPGDIELEAVISVMSSDGVLKILAPKKEGHNGKHFSIDVKDMDDVEATVSRKFRNGHRLTEEYLRNRDSSSDDEELRAFAKQSNNQYRVTFQDDDEEFEGGHMFNKETKMTSNSSKDFKYNIPSLSMETRVLHIERRGVFAEDYCFANVRNSFSQAVREVLEKASEWTCRSDAMHNYRRLRQRDLKLENQAVGILDDQDSHKIVMDVFDFMKGDVTVQLVKGKELLVEGQAERQDGGRVSRVSFVRRFALPELVERDAVSCVLSSDGILTITCRKRASGYSARGFCSERKPYVDTAGGWEDKDAKDSLADWEGASSRAFSTGSRSRYHRSYAKQY